MKNTSSLDQIILIYINYILPTQRFAFSYENLQEIIYKITKKTFSVGTLRKELSILRKSGLVTSKLRYRKPVAVLTLDGRLAIFTTLAYKKFGPWDKKWRIVVSNIPENDNKYRLKFYSELKQIGFAKMDRNLFISAHPLLASAKRTASHYGIDRYCTFLEACKIEGQNRAVEKAWNTGEIAKSYSDFIKTAKKALKARKSPLWPFEAKRLELDFARIYNQDPHLPEELLPKNWHGDEAYQIYKKILASY